MKKTVLVVHNHYKQYGGEDAVFENEVDLLKKNGHRVFEYTRDNNEIDGMNILQKISVPISNFFSIRTFLEVRQMIRKYQVDIVHVHNTMPLVGPAVFYAAFSMHIPVVQTLHNFRLLCPCGTFLHSGKICTDAVTKGLKCSLRDRCYHDSYVQTFLQVAALKLHRILGTYRRVNFICLTEFNRQMLLKANDANHKPIFDPNKLFIKPNFAELPHEKE